MSKVVVLPGGPTGHDPREDGRYGEWKTIKGRGPMAKLELAATYQRVFTSGEATVEDAQVVLADLAQFSGFYAVSGGDNDPVALGRREGNREVFGRIFAHLNMTDLERGMLEKASREQALVNIYDGEI